MHNTILGYQVSNAMGAIVPMLMIGFVIVIILSFVRILQRKR